MPAALLWAFSAEILFLYLCLERPRRLSGQSPSICYRRPLACLKAPLGLSLLRNRRLFGTAFLREGSRRKTSQAHIRSQSLFLRPKRVCKGFFRAFRGDSMHFRGHSRRIAPLLPPFVVYYGHRAVLCSICHSRNSYRAENRPVTANRAVFCFLRVRVVHRVVSAHLRGDSCPKPSKAGKTWYTGYNKKRPAWKGD